MPFVDNNDLENHPTEMCERCVKFGIACFQSEGIDYYDLDHEQLIGQIDQTSGGDVTRRKDEHSNSMTKPKLQTDDKFQLLFPNEIINNYAKYLFWGGLIAFIGFNTFKRTS
ncbi:hypothetical protein RDWZM_000109 [Blomia tropicalis]|uniref:Uncharacterized protein n=1 Tax=Blomia tropicalis TaxID=40697 RepID=A0A9Q0M9S8_BLOTA|nr:hypothetical protein RDWZM_000109 [Blomia tropicalis]